MGLGDAEKVFVSDLCGLYFNRNSKCITLYLATAATGSSLLLMSGTVKTPTTSCPFSFTRLYTSAANCKIN